jgi:hypothetical protein
MSDPWEYSEDAIVKLKTKIKEKYNDENENVLDEVKKWVEDKRFDYTANELTEVIDKEIEKQKMKFVKGNLRPLRGYHEINIADNADKKFLYPTPPSFQLNRKAIRAGKRTRKYKKTKKRRARSHKRR